MLLPGACDGYLKFSEASTQIEEGAERWQKWVNLAQQGKSLYEWGLRSIDIGTALALCGDRPAVGAIGLGFRVLGLGFRVSERARCHCCLQYLQCISRAFNAVSNAPSGYHCLLAKGSWDLVTRLIIKVTILIVTYNSN